MPIPYAQGKFRLTRGSKVSDSRCEAPFEAGGCGALGGDYFARQKEKRIIAEKKHIATLIEGIPEASEDFSGNPLLTVLSKTFNAAASTGEEDFDTFFQVGALVRRIKTDLDASVEE